MLNSIELRILLPTDKDAVLALGREFLAKEIPDPMEHEMASWNARWRDEALEHYLKLGWSFGVYSDGRLTGFALAQPFLFYRGLTQTLWIEHLAARTSEAAHALLDTAYKWARDKHFQCVLVESGTPVDQAVENFKNVRRLDGPWIELRSAKF